MRLIDADKLRHKDMNGGVVDIFDVLEAPTVEAIPIDKPFLKMKYKGYTVYKTEWLKEHIEMEYRVIKGISAKAEAIPVEWIEKWVETDRNSKRRTPYYYKRLFRSRLKMMLEDWGRVNGQT